MTRYIATAEFDHPGLQKYVVGDVLDDAINPYVRQLLADGAPLTVESMGVTSAAKSAVYFGRDSIAGFVTGLQQGPIVMGRGSAGSGNMGRGLAASIPAEEPVLRVTLAGAAETGSNLVEMRGSATGFYALWITDTCGIVSNGQCNFNARWSPFNNVSPLVLGRAYMYGSSDDFAQNAEKTFAHWVAEINHADLDLIQSALTNETRHRFRVGRLGEIGWGDGATTESDVLIVHDAANQLTFQIGVAHANALRIAEAADGETALLVRRNITGAFTLQRVSMGIADSGGAGFKLLRVPN